MLTQLKRKISASKKPACSICRQPISSRHEGTTCPSCQTWFHFRHFREAVKVFGCCPICKSQVRIVDNQKEEDISPVIKMRGYYKIMPLSNVFSLKTFGWQNNTFRDVTILGEVIQIFPEKVSPRQHRYRKVIIRDETTSATLQVWGITRIRQLDDCRKGDILVIKNPKRPYLYHEQRGIDLWVHENYSFLEIL